MTIIYKAVVFFIVLSVLVIIHELGHFIAAKRNGVKVEEFGFGLPPRLFGMRFGETLYSLNALPFGGFVKVYGEESAELNESKLSAHEKSRSFVHKGLPAKITILVAGVTMNFILGWFIYSYLFVKGIPVPANVVTIENVMKSSPAADAGIQKGDKIATITYQNTTLPIHSRDDITRATEKFAGKKTTLALTRNGTPVQVQIVPRKNPPEEQGALGVVVSDFIIEKHSINEAPFYALKRAATMTFLIFRELSRALVNLVTLQGSKINVVGPFGIAEMTGQAAQAGLDPLLELVALLSINLAVINIMPFPALDGGRLTMILYEAVSKKKINPNLEQKLNFVGFACLLGLMALVTIKEIINALT